MADNRLDRAQQTREASKREQRWKPPSTLPTPNPREGYVHRWMRISTMGQDDGTHVSSRLREGWEPCRLAEYPELELAPSVDSRFKDQIIVGGLMLARMPESMAAQREQYYADQAQVQTTRYTDQYMGEATDHRMPKFKDTSSTVTVGSKPE